MDLLEEFLSPEALRQLLDSDDFATAHDKTSITTSDQSHFIITPVAAAVNTPIPDQNKPTRKRLTSDANFPGCSTLVLDKAGSAKPKRAKFSAEGRAKVANVRKKGACMKCHRDKIPCSGEWPCESCCRSRAVVAGRASRQRWMECVPFSVKDLDIFANEIVQEDHLTNELARKYFDIACFEYSKIWINEEAISIKIRCGTVCSDLHVTNSQSLLHYSEMAISSCADSRLEKAFVIIVNLLTCIDGNSHNRENIWNARSVAGSRLLQCLEKLLSNSSLSGFGVETLRALLRILCLTIFVVMKPPPTVQSLPGAHDKQQQLIRVLIHHVVYIGERLDVWKGLDSKMFSGKVTSVWQLSDESCRMIQKGILGRNGNYNNQVSTVAENRRLCPTEHHKQPPGEASAATATTSRPRKGGVSQSTLHAQASTVSEQGSDRAIVHRHTTVESPYLPNTQPEDRSWKFSNDNQISPAISATTVAPIPEQQTDTVCSWCGSFQPSYKPSEGVVLCDVCLPQYQLNDFAASGSGWDIGQPQSIDHNPTSGLDAFEDDSTNYATWPDLIAPSSYGDDIDDFSWFMES